MADVIFNGSSSRKSLGLAEVTIAFDNARRLLAIDADEVQLTRRVYRDGTGEYLINGEMARLKDIKELFLGSGAAGGNTIIAQAASMSCSRLPRKTAGKFLTKPPASAASKQRSWKRSASSRPWS